MSEKKTYRANLEELNEFMGGKRLMSAKQVGLYLGIDPRTAAKRYGITKDGITTPTLASMISK